MDQTNISLGGLPRSKGTLLQKRVGVADTASRDLDQDLTSLRLINRNFFDRPWRARLLDDDGTAALRNVRSHCGESTKEYRALLEF